MTPAAFHAMAVWHFERLSLSALTEKCGWLPISFMSFSFTFCTRFPFRLLVDLPAFPLLLFRSWEHFDCDRMRKRPSTEIQVNTQETSDCLMWVLQRGLTSTVNSKFLLRAQHWRIGWYFMRTLRDCDSNAEGLFPYWPSLKPVYTLTTKKTVSIPSIETHSRVNVAYRHFASTKRNMNK